MGRRSRKRGEVPAGDGTERRASAPSPARPSRGRSGSSTGQAGASGAGRRASARAAEPTGAARRAPIGAAEPPRAPWHPFPLTELCVLIGLVLLVWGVIRRNDPAGRVLLVCGMALGSLGGLETALREHFTGARSHSSVLAALPAVLVAGVLFFARAPWLAVPVAAVVVFAAAFAALRRAHRRVAPAGRLG